MGIAINYEYSFEGSKEQLIERLKAIREDIVKLELREMSEVIEVDAVKPQELKGEARDLAMFLAFSLHIHPRLQSLLDDGDLRPDERMFEQVNGAGFFVLVSEGCEPFSVALGRIADNSEWYGCGFTKTMGAADFEKAHRTVIDMLKICQKNGILESVTDEAGIWKDTA